MLKILMSIFRSFRFQLKSRLSRFLTERKWDYASHAEDKFHRFACSFLSTPTGANIFVNNHLVQEIEEKYQVQTLSTHTDTPQKFAQISVLNELEDYPSVPHFSCKSEGFAVVAVFYFEWECLPFWLGHYRRQGAAHFFLYFNSNRVPVELERITAAEDDVTLILWPFQYFTTSWKVNSGHPFQSAQIIALQHSLSLVAERTPLKYILTCDLDEFIIGHKTIAEAIESEPKEISFANFWARGYSGFISGNAPLISKQAKWQPWRRVKSVVDSCQINRLDVHRIWDEDNLDTDFLMLHFKDLPKGGWVDPFRKNDMDEIENVRLDEHPSPKVRSLWSNFLDNKIGR